MRMHLVSLPHTQTTAEYNNCAFATLTRGFARMMTKLGHEVVLYSGEDNDAPVAEHVTCITKAQQRSIFNIEGPADILRSPLDVTMYEPQQPWWPAWNRAVIAELETRIRPQEFVCLIGGGVLFDPIVQLAHESGCIPVEYAVGYAGVHPRTFHAFGSSNWQHVVFGLERPQGWLGKPYDRVIPHYFDPSQFTYRAQKDDYFLYLGKLKEDKGVNVAARACKAAGARLIVAGQGPTPVEYGEVHNRWIGVEERRELLAGARGLFVPSQYTEPFGMIAVEGLLSGTPIITTPWGGLGEINSDGRVGYVCNVMRDYVDAVEHIDKIEPAACWARGRRYTEDAVAPLYDRWFGDLAGLWGEGWGAI